MKAALGMVFPPQCLNCGDPVADEGALCPACWREAEFIGNPACNRCGAPLPGESGADESDADETGTADFPDDPAAPGQLLCDDCLAIWRPWQRGRAALVYRGTGRALALALKHRDRPDLVPALGRWLAAAAAPLVRPGMIVVPVPLHARRMLRRKYNQAALLAAQVARAHGLDHHAAALVRVRHTPMQDHRGVEDRFANQSGALAVPPRRRAAIAGRAVLLIDDVMASGATLTTAALALREAGAGPVAVAVLARAVKDGSAEAPGPDGD